VGHHEKSAIIGNVTLQCGAGYQDDNIRAVLDALWQVADDRNTVDRSVFEPHLLRIRRHVEALEKFECVRLTFGSERGRPIRRITLLKKQFVKRQRAAGIAALSNELRKPQPIKPHIVRVVKEVVQEPHCLVFIDVPNVCHFRNHAGTTGKMATYLHPSRVNWLTFKQVILEMTRVPAQHQSIYAYVRTSQVPESAIDNLKSAFINVLRRDKKDVDPLMITDIILKTLPHLEKNRTVKIVVASGDSDYAYALKSIREHGRKIGAQVSTYALTWKEQASLDIGRVANQVFLIENFLDRLDPVGARMLAEHNRLTRLRMETFVGNLKNA